MNNYLLLVVLPGMSTFLTVFCLTGLAACIVGSLKYHALKEDACNQEDHDKAARFGKNLVRISALSIALFFAACIIPSKKDIALLKVISVVSELNGIDQIPQKLIDRLTDVLDEGNIVINDRMIEN